jgi:hypothetical protein
VAADPYESGRAALFPPQGRRGDGQPRCPAADPRRLPDNAWSLLTAKWSKAWFDLFRITGHLDGEAFRTVSRITEKGQERLAAHEGSHAIAATLAARALRRPGLHW